MAPISADGISRIKFSLLIDNPETRVVENQLTKGTEFVFCEGARIVAVGIVI